MRENFDQTEEEESLMSERRKSFFRKFPLQLVVQRLTTTQGTLLRDVRFMMHALNEVFKTVHPFFF